jgi:hypothetical protein
MPTTWTGRLSPKWLRDSRLKPKTVSGHLENVSFFINECLLSDEIPRTPAEGVRWVDYFLGYWFIRKAAWASPESIRANAGSIRKFYAFMAETGRVPENGLEYRIGGSGGGFNGAFQKDALLDQWMTRVRYRAANLQEESWDAGGTNTSPQPGETPALNSGLPPGRTYFEKGYIS